MRDDEEERNKQGQTNNKAKQYSTPKTVTFLRKMSCLGWDIHVYTGSKYLQAHPGNRNTGISREAIIE